MEWVSSFCEDVPVSDVTAWHTQCRQLAREDGCRVVRSRASWSPQHELQSPGTDLSLSGLLPHTLGTGVLQKRGPVLQSCTHTWLISQSSRHTWSRRRRWRRMQKAEESRAQGRPHNMEVSQQMGNTSRALQNTVPLLCPPNLPLDSLCDPL